jgi:hypothetical protein
MLPVRCPNHTPLVDRLVDVESVVRELHDRPNADALLPMLEEFRRTAEQAFVASASNSRSLELLFDEFEKLKHLVRDIGDQIATERETRATERSAELRAVVDLYREERQSRHEIEVAERRDEAEEHRSRRALRAKLVSGVIAIVVALIGAYQGGRVSAGPHCSHSAVSQ